MEGILAKIGRIEEKGIHSLIREYQADLGEYIKDCYLEAYKQDCIERAKKCHPTCDEIRISPGYPDNWHYCLCMFGRKWTMEDEVSNQTSHRNCFDVHCNEPGYENRVIWIQSPRVMKDHGQYLRDVIMARVLRKQIFADYEARGQLRIEYFASAAAEAAVETAHQRKMTVIFQFDSLPLLKPPTKFGKFQRWRRQNSQTWLSILGLCLALLIGIGIKALHQMEQQEAAERAKMFYEYRDAYEQVYGTGTWYKESNSDHRWEAINKYLNASMMSIQQLRDIHDESMARYRLYFKAIKEFGCIQLRPEWREAVARDHFNPRMSFGDVKKSHERLIENLRAWSRHVLLFTPLSSCSDEEDY